MKRNGEQGGMGAGTQVRRARKRSAAIAMRCGDNVQDDDEEVAAIVFEADEEEESGGLAAANVGERLENGDYRCIVLIFGCVACTEVLYCCCLLFID